MLCKKHVIRKLNQSMSQERKQQQYDNTCDRLVFKNLWFRKKLDRNQSAIFDKLNQPTDSRYILNIITLNMGKGNKYPQIIASITGE